MPPMDLAALRERFPHTQSLIYLNHASTAPLSRPVMAAVEGYLERRHRGEVGFLQEMVGVTEATRAALAGVLGAAPDRVAFQPNTSHALNVLALGLDWRPGDRVAVPACEYPANVYPFMNLRRLGVELDFIPHREGVFDPDDVARTLRPRTRVVSVSWVQFLSGFRVDLKPIGELCRERGVWLSVDAIQGLGAIRLDGGAEAHGIDFLAGSAQKWLMGMHGVGFLYLSPALQDALTPPQAGHLHGPLDWDRLFDYELTFHPDARRFELGVPNQAGIVALRAALDQYAEASPAWCEERVVALSRRLAAGAEALGLARYGTAEPAHASGIVTVRHPEPEDAEIRLQEAGIRASLRNRMLRFSPTYYNSEAEIDRTLEVLAASIGSPRPAPSQPADAP